jgi:biotin transporter BioY
MVGMAVSVLVCYAFGTVWFMVFSAMGCGEPSIACCLLAGDALKILLAALHTPG